MMKWYYVLAALAGSVTLLSLSRLVTDHIFVGSERHRRYDDVTSKIGCSIIIVFFIVLAIIAIKFY